MLLPDTTKDKWGPLEINEMVSVQTQLRQQVLDDTECLLLKTATLFSPPNSECTGQLSDGLSAAVRKEEIR